MSPEVDARKRQTNIHRNDPNPFFDEHFKFPVSQDELKEKILILQVRKHSLFIYQDSFVFSSNFSLLSSFSLSLIYIPYYISTLGRKQNNKGPKALEKSTKTRSLPYVPYTCIFISILPNVSTLRLFETGTTYFLKVDLLILPAYGT
jgi:hypothetical protein